MSLSERDRQVLTSVEDELASSDPKLASMLACFSRLAVGEEMPAHETIHSGWRRAAARSGRAVPSPGRRGRPPPARARWRLGWTRKVVALWLVISLALIAAALAVRHEDGTRSCAPRSVTCAGQGRPQVTQSARRQAGRPESAHGL
jgi:hypothetical protein